jgi:hypothetical protein
MRVWLHISLTLFLTVVSTVAAIFVAIVAGFNFDEFLRMHDLPRWFVYSVWLLPFLALQVSGLVMRWIPCACPQCGGKARLGLGTGSLMRPAPLRTGGNWAWSCKTCRWSTRRWSAFYRG